MQRICYVSCGKSIESSICWKPIARTLETDNLSVVTQAAVEADPHRGALREDVAAIIRDGKAAENFEEYHWRNPTSGALSAELATLRLLLARRDQQDRSDRRGRSLETAPLFDTIYLVHDPNINAHARALNDIIVKDSLWSPRSRPNVKFLRIDGLDADSPASFRRALDDLRDQMRSTAKEVSRGDEVVLALTGGFKGTVAAMLLFAWDLKGGEGFSNVSACYKHERSPGLIWLPVGPGEKFLGNH